MRKDFEGSSRAGFRAKRKKTNLILNGLIVMVLVLIAFVAYSIFFAGGNETAPKKEVKQTTAAKSTAEKQSAHKINKDEASTKKSSTSNQQKEDTKNQQKEDTKNQDKGDAANAADSQKDNPTDQLQTVQGPDSSAAATANAGQHVTSYDSNSADWQEMLGAISSATGVDRGNMTVWFLGSDKSTPNGSVGTVSAKDNKQQKYRVYLQYVDGQGWKATKVEPAQ